jgi:hypothetical protein
MSKHQNPRQGTSAPVGSHPLNRLSDPEPSRIGLHDLLTRLAL